MKTTDAIGHFILSRKSKGLSHQTIIWYEGILENFAEAYPIIPTNPASIELFLTELTAGDERRQGYYRTLRCFYKFLNARYRIKNPIDKMDQPRIQKKVPIILTPQEINTLLCAAAGPIKTAILFFIDTGARLSEYISFRIGDLHETPDGFFCTIRGKTGERTIPLSYETYHALMVTPPWTSSNWWLCRQVSNTFKKAGLKGSAHTLRHSFATLWNGDELVLQQIMGHSKLETTKMYRQFRIERMIMQHRQYSPLKMVLSSYKNML